MLTTKENQLLTETGPGTPGGAFFRRYWLPVLQADELADPDGPPVRGTLLGERLVAFRDTHGRVGLLDEFCSHRGASLALARVEDGGLQCLYHGWKYDVEGRCLETPAEPASSNFKYTVRHSAYPTHEAGGVVWAYLGPKDLQPPFPSFQWTSLPERQRIARKILGECNYLQQLEGGVDGTHSSFLHRALTEDYSPWGIALTSSLSSVGTECLEIEMTAYGFRIGAVAPHGETQQVRITQFILPCFTYVAEHRGGDTLFHAWVPRDDGSVWTWDIWFNLEKPIDAPEHLDRRGVWVDENFRKLRNVDNQWMQDREAMRTRSFSGIYGILTQDQAIQESMGPIYDRSREHLATTDRGVVALRQVLLDALQGVERGEEPLGVPGKVPLDNICSASYLLPADRSWQEATPLPAELMRVDPV